MEDKKNNQKGTAIDWDELHMELERRKRAAERRKKEALARGASLGRLKRPGNIIGLMIWHRRRKECSYT